MATDWNFGDIFVIYKSCKMIIIYGVTKTGT